MLQIVRARRNGASRSDEGACTAGEVHVQANGQNPEGRRRGVVKVRSGREATADDGMLESFLRQYATGSKPVRALAAFDLLANQDDDLTARPEIARR